MTVLRVFLTIFFINITVVHAVNFLMPNEAFKPYAKIKNSSQIVIGIALAPEVYLYKDKVHITLLKPKELSIEKIIAPNAVKHAQEEIYLHTVEFIVALKKENYFSKKQDIEIKLSYQGCSTKGLCYEPIQKILKVNMEKKSISFVGQNKKLTLKKIPLLNREKVAVEKKPIWQEKSQTDLIADKIKSGNFFTVTATFFLFGLLLSLTPCVFPMIPIISGVIVSQGRGLSTKKAFMLSLVYVFAMATAYTIAGVIAALFGANLQSALQKPFVIYSFSALFVFLALSMFGYYELKLPNVLVKRVSKNSKRGGFLGVALMGFLSALIVGPCVAAPLAGALVYIGQSGDVLLGGLALFSMGVGMGVPLIIVGVSAGRFMPKPGEWMHLVNAFFGLLMLCVAVWMLERVLPFFVITFLYAVLGIGFALFLGFCDKKEHIVKRTIALLLFLYSFALFLSVLAGEPNLKEPLGFLRTTALFTKADKKESYDLHFIKVTSLDELHRILKANRGKKILVDFSAKWCSACRELEEETFSDVAVQQKLREFLLIRADVTKNQEQQQTLLRAYGLFGPPAILFFDAEGKALTSKTVVGFVKPKKLLDQLSTI